MSYVMINWGILSRVSLKVRVLKQTHGTEYRPDVKEGDIGFVLSCVENIHVLCPVEVQFVGCTECFMFNELEFVN